ncbi:MAG: c-type cytochrome [Methylovulum sp.]|nr:c-type cytochrome [Methylovulum sp.]
MSALKHFLLIPVLSICFWTTPAVSVDLSAGGQKAASCVGCHGAQGKSNNNQWPNLAAQQATYLANQLNAFKSGTRANAMMQAMATNLSDDDINNLAAYFTGLPAVSSGGDAALASAGAAKSAMCLGCHGAKAQGNGQFPRLAGQQPEYLLAQLKGFKEGSRKNGMMQAIVANLSEQDMQQLAAYFGGL